MPLELLNFLHATSANIGGKNLHSYIYKNMQYSLMAKEKTDRDVEYNKIPLAILRNADIHSTLV